MITAEAQENLIVKSSEYAKDYPEKLNSFLKSRKCNNIKIDARNFDYLKALDLIDAVLIIMEGDIAHYWDIDTAARDKAYDMMIDWMKYIKSAN